jgi:hypothetical protein
MEQKIFPTWGYKADGSERLFDLKEGESLPDGWSDRQELWNHPNTRHLHSGPTESASPAEADIPEWRRGTPGRPPVDEEPEPGQGDPDTQPRKRGRPRSTESTGL